jgi:hypothetical protein
MLYCVHIKKAFLSVDTLVLFSFWLVEVKVEL